MTAALIYEKAWTERPCLTHAGKKKKRASLQQRGKNPSKGYVTQLITIKMDWESSTTPLTPDTLQ